MLRQFHFIDQNGKDQGINVRNRSKELVELLSDVEKIRSERKKARTTRNKYGGYEGGAGGSGSTGGRYGGFGSESAGAGGSSGYGAYSGGVYGDGGGFGGEEIEVGTTQARRERFEEYDEYNEGDAPATSSRRKETPTSPKVKQTKAAAAAAPPPKAKQPEVDLFSFDDPEPAASSSAAIPLAAPAASSNLAADDDDFDDFQSAPSAPAAATNTFAMPAPTAAPIQPQAQASNGMFGGMISPPAANRPAQGFPSMGASTSTTPSVQSPPQPSGYQASQPNYYTSVSVPSTANGSQQAGRSTPQSLGALGKPAGGIESGAAKPKGGDPFASLLGGGAKTGQPAKKATMGDMAKQQGSAALWGTSATPAPQQPAQQGQQQKLGGGLDDLLG